MPYHANLLKVVTDVLELPEGASFNDLKKTITDFEDKDCHKSKVERAILEKRSNSYLNPIAGNPSSPESK
jgi:hypothetical protein